MNVSDSERIASYLEAYGFKYESKRELAGVVVLNTCGIRQSAENRNYGLIPAIRKANKGVKIVLAGCLSERRDVRGRLKEAVDIWLPITELPLLYKKLGLKEKKFKEESYLSISPKINSKFSAFIPIGNGCNNFCSYCVVPFARGREKYRPAFEIIKETESFLKQGFKEIFLIAQNVNSYNVKVVKKDLNYFSRKKIGDIISFPEILNAVDEIKIKKDSADFWIRFATSHPKNMSDELIKVIAKSKNITRYIHLPVQAGDDQILEKMNRKYTVKHYLSLVKKIRQAIPEVGLSTDIIVGFPGETKKQFANTEKLMKQAGYDMAYLSQYSPRPGTASFKMKDNVSLAEKARREKVLNDILSASAFKSNKKFLNKNIVVLVEEKNKRGEWIGKNEQNKTIKIFGSADKKLAGQFVKVKITKIHDFGLDGKIV